MTAGAREPWGVSLAALARRGTTAELVVTSGDQRVTLRLDQGRLVEARSTAIVDSVIRVGLIHQLILPRQVPELERRLAEAADGDEVAVVQAALSLSEQGTAQLRARLLVHRVARTFALAQRTVELRDVKPSAITRRGVDVREPIYSGARMHLRDDQLRAEVRRLGSYFVLHADAPTADYGFGDDEQHVLEALSQGASVAELESRLQADPRMVLAVVYALASCRDVDALDRGRVVTVDFEAVSFARGTIDDVGARLIDQRVAADGAVTRASWALRNNQPETAVTELGHAIELDPETVDYRAQHAWARFCAAKDKKAIAGEIRGILTKVMRISTRPELARFYLGRLERMLGHDREALLHIQEVLKIQPRHAEACAEARILLARLSTQERVRRTSGDR